MSKTKLNSADTQDPGNTEYFHGYEMTELNTQDPENFYEVFIDIALLHIIHGRTEQLICFDFFVRLWRSGDAAFVKCLMWFVEMFFDK